MDFSYFTAAPQPYQFFGVPDAASHGQALHLEDYQTHINSVSFIGAVDSQR